MSQPGYFSIIADDTNLTVAGETIEEVELAMNNDLARIKEWLLTNKLSLKVESLMSILIINSNGLTTLISLLKGFPQELEP